MVRNELQPVQLGEPSIGVAAGLQVEAGILHGVALVLRLLHGNLVFILLRHVHLHMKISMLIPAGCWNWNHNPGNIQNNTKTLTYLHWFYATEHVVETPRHYIDCYTARLSVTNRCMRLLYIM